LLDIIEQIHTIQRYVAGYTREAFLDDPILQDAVIRRFEIIGEAASRRQFATSSRGYSSSQPRTRQPVFKLPRQ